MDIENTLQKLHIDALNPMQCDTADALLHSDRDIITLAPTGSGKTLDYRPSTLDGVPHAAEHHRLQVGH